MAPLLFGPLITAVAMVTVAVIVGPTEGLIGGPFMNWLVAVVLFGGLTLIQGACLLGFDRLLVWFGRPTLTRRTAWLAGLVAPLPVAAIWQLAPPGRQSGAMFWFALFAPFLGIAVVVRLACARIFRRDI